MSCTDINSWKDFGYYMFITFMVSGIIVGGIYSMKEILVPYSYLFLAVGLCCIPIYIKECMKERCSNCKRKGWSVHQVGHGCNYCKPFEEKK